MEKYRATAKTYEFNVEVSRGKIKNTELWDGGTRLIQIFIAMWLVYMAMQFAWGYDRKVSLHPVEYVHIQSWITSLFILGITVLWIWVIERVRNKTIYTYKIESLHLNDTKKVYKMSGIYSNPTILNICLNDLERIE